MAVRVVELAEGRVILQTPHALAVVENPVQDASGEFRPGCLIRADLVDVLSPICGRSGVRVWYVLAEPRLPYALGGIG
jgi:hypothetical protein